MTLVKWGLIILLASGALFAIVVTTLATYRTAAHIYAVEAADPAAFWVWVKGKFTGGEPIDMGIREKTEIAFAIEAINGRLLDKTGQPKGRLGLNQYRIKVSRLGGDTVKNLDATIAFPLPVSESDIEGPGGAVGIQFAWRSTIDGGSWAVVGNAPVTTSNRWVGRQFGLKVVEFHAEQPVSLWVVLDHRPHIQMGNMPRQLRVPRPGFLYCKYSIETPGGEIEREIYQPITLVEGMMQLGDPTSKPDKLSIYGTEGEWVED